MTPRNPDCKVPTVADAFVGAPGTWRLTDEDGTPIGFVAIDRIVAGRSCGGIRASPSVTALEIERIARTMTLKCGFAGLAAGGAKGGVIVPADFTPAQRTARLKAFGRAASPLLRSGVWSHGADMGTTDRDIKLIRHAAGIGPDPDDIAFDRGPRPAEVGSGDAAGLTVALATEAVLEWLGIDPSGARIAIQGAGAVGRSAMLSLTDSGARIVALATAAGTLQDKNGLDVRAIEERLTRLGDQATYGGEPPAAVLSVPCDALLLCAGSDTVGPLAASRIESRAVVCGANIPFADDAGSLLQRRGIAVIPDFVGGVGGVLGSTLVAAVGATSGEVATILRRDFKPLVAQVLVASAAQATSIEAEARVRALRTIAACEAAYGSERPETLLADRLASREPWPVRLALAVERRTRGSSRLAWLGRLLHDTAVAHAGRVLRAAWAAGGGERPADGCCP